MNVIVKRSVLDGLMKQLAENRSRQSVRIDQIAGDDKVVIPDEQMSTQMSQDKVPVEDPNFLPVNTDQLTKAASQIARDVKPSEVQKFYSSMKKLLRQDDTQLSNISEANLQKFLGADDGEDQTPDPGIEKVTTQKKVSAKKAPKKIDILSNSPQEDNIDVSSADVDDIIDANNAADDIIILALDKKMLTDYGEMITIIDPKTKEKLTFGQSMSKTIDDTNEIMNSLFSKNEVGNTLSSLSGVSKKIAKEKVRAELMKMLAKRPDLDTIATHFSNGILDMTIRNTEYPQFENAINNIATSFSILSDNSIVSVKIPGAKTPYKIEVPKDIDIGKLESLIRQKLIAGKKTYIADPENVDIVKPETEDDDADSPESDDLEKVKSELDIMAAETGVPVGTLRNLSSDLSFIFGKKEKDNASPIDLSEIKIGNYIQFIQSIYEDVIRDRGRNAFEKYLLSDDDLDTQEAIIMSSKMLNDDFFVFLQDNIDDKDKIMDIINAYVKLFIKSDEFTSDFPELDEFKDMSKIIASQITATEHRLGLRDINVISRFILGFDIVAQELIERCVKYITDKLAGQLANVNLDPKIISKLDKLINVNSKTGKTSLNLSFEDTMDKIKSFSEISNYTDPDLALLKELSTDFSRTLDKSFKKKVSELINDIATQFEGKIGKE